MLEILNTVINREGRYTNENFTYETQWVITNGELASVQCTVYPNKREVYEPTGYLRREGGRVHIDFEQGASFLEHIETFGDIIVAIETAMFREAEPEPAIE